MGVRGYELIDEEWEGIRGYIPQSKRGRPPKDHRQMLNGMMRLEKWGDVRRPAGMVWPVENSIQPIL